MSPNCFDVPHSVAATIIQQRDSSSSTACTDYKEDERRRAATIVVCELVVKGAPLVGWIEGDRCGAVKGNETSHVVVCRLANGMAADAIYQRHRSSNSAGV